MNKDITKVLEHLDHVSKIRPGAWVVTYQDKGIVMSSGKSVWKRENHAKSALTNHIETVFTNNEIREWGFKDGKEISHYLQNAGIVKIKQL